MFRTGTGIMWIDRMHIRETVTLTQYLDWLKDDKPRSTRAMINKAIAERWNALAGSKMISRITQTPYGCI